MSLLDALLLDPWRDPRDIYIARRTDGQRGLGTINDPFDGGTRADTPFPAGLTFDPTEFVIQVSTGQVGLHVGGNFSIHDVSGADYFNDDFTVIEILETQLVSGVEWPSLFTAKTTDVPTNPPDVQFFSKAPDRYKLTYTGQAEPAGITISWPVAKVVPDQDRGLVSFDTVTISVISDSAFAGTFPILGAHGADHSFRFRLTGLTLPSAVSSSLSCAVTRWRYRFDEIMRAALPYSVIHLGPGTFQTRGFSGAYSSNADGTQTYVGYRVKAGQRVMGCGLAATNVQLVQPVDEINQTTVFSGIGVDSVEISDLTIDCNGPSHVAPYGIFPAPVTCGGVDLGGSFIRVHRVRVIQFCVQARAECFGIILGAANYPAQPTFNVIEDCILEQPSENNTHETTLLSSVGHGVAANARSPIVRHNYVNCTYANGISSERLRINMITYDGDEAIVETSRPHHRTGMNNVVLTNVLKKIGVGQHDQEILASAFSDTFPIIGFDPGVPTKFRIKKPADAPTAEGDLRYVDAGGSVRATIGVDFHASEAFSGTGCVTEGNSAYDCNLGSYIDTGSTRDGVLRDNYYSNTLYGLWHNLIAPDTFRDGESLMTLLDSSPPTAEYKTMEPHGLSEGQAVQLTAEPAENYSGVFSVKQRIDDSRFRFEPHPNSDGSVQGPSDVGTYAARWQTNHFAIESNVFDLYANDPSSGVAPIGINLSGGRQVNPYLFPQILISGNIIRSIDNAPDTGGSLLRTRAMFLNGVENVIASHNIIPAVEVFPIAFDASLNIQTVNNHTSLGQPVHGQLFFGSATSKDLATLIEDALVLAF